MTKSNGVQTRNLAWAPFLFMHRPVQWNYAAEAAHGPRSE